MRKQMFTGINFLWEQIFAGTNFREWTLDRENRKNLCLVKISRYTVTLSPPHSDLLLT